MIGCPRGWEKNGEFCYSIKSELKTWNEALNFCKESGGNLASIEDQQENDFIQSKSKSSFNKAQNKFEFTQK